MQFQIHKYPAGDSYYDVVLVAEFTPEEAMALQITNSWNSIAIDRMRNSGFFTMYRIRKVSYRELVSPGLLMKDMGYFNVQEFEHDFRSVHSLQIQANMTPIFTKARRIVHKQLEQQRDAYFAQAQLTYQPQGNVQAFTHNQRYLPPPR